MGVIIVRMNWPKTGLTKLVKLVMILVPYGLLFWSGYTWILNKIKIICNSITNKSANQ